MRNHLRIAFCLVALLLVVFALYYPGLSGPFIFDDIPNLKSLGDFGGVTDWPSALYFIFSGGAGPLGRPLTLLSFLINDSSWPTDAYGFKYTNVMLHLLNGVLVFVLGRLLGARFLREDERKVDLFALIATAIWLIHPIQVSAALFVVQRMTLLSSLFILLALISYLHYRTQNYRASGVIACSALVVVCITFGAFCKENAVMAIFYIAVIESLLFQKREGLWRQFYSLVTVGCMVLMLALIVSAINADAAWVRRDFTLSQRLLTESRILWRYVAAIVLPRPADFSLFNDDYIVSVSVFKPISTLWALIAWLASLIMAVCLRTKVPLLLFALSWYMAGHLMESTVLPLELYFDHRNYLPMLGICWLLTALWLRLPVRAELQGILMALSLLLLGLVLIANIKVWASEDMMAEIWAIDHPDSARAQHMVVLKAISSNEGGKAKQLIEQALLRHPDNAYLLVQQILVSCMLKEEANPEHFRNLLGAMRQKIGVTAALGQLQGRILEGNCPGLGVPDLESFYAAILANKFYGDARSRAELHLHRAALAVAQRDLDLAIDYMDKAYQADPHNIQLPLQEALWLADAGLFDDARHYLSVAGATRPKNYFQKFQYREQLRIVEEQIAAMKNRRT